METPFNRLFNKIRLGLSSIGIVFLSCNQINGQAEELSPEIVKAWIDDYDLDNNTGQSRLLIEVATLKYGFMDEFAELIKFCNDSIPSAYYTKEQLNNANYNINLSLSDSQFVAELTSEGTYWFEILTQAMPDGNIDPIVFEYNGLNFSTQNFYTPFFNTLKQKVKAQWTLLDDDDFRLLKVHVSKGKVNAAYLCQYGIKPQCENETFWYYDVIGRKRITKEVFDEKTSGFYNQILY